MDFKSKQTRQASKQKQKTSRHAVNFSDTQTKENETCMVFLVNDHIFFVLCFWPCPGQYMVNDEMRHESVKVPFSCFKSQTRREMMAKPAAVSVGTLLDIVVEIPCCCYCCCCCCWLLPLLCLLFLFLFFLSKFLPSWFILLHFSKTSLNKDCEMSRNVKKN